MIPALNWAFDQQTSSSAKIVLISLSDYANEDWECYPSIAALEWRTCLDRKTIITAIQTLKDEGLISDTGERVGRTGQIPVYRLNMEQSQKRNSSGFSSNSPVFTSNSPKNGTAKQSQKRDTEPSVLNHQEPSVQPPIPKKGKASLDEVKLCCAKSGISDQDAEWFWNKMEGCGWKNGGKPVVDWMRTLISWKLAGYLASQRSQTNGNGYHAPPKIPEKTLGQREFDKVYRREMGGSQ